MSAATWKDCFDYLIHYGSIGGHPPFLPQTKFNVFLSRFHLIMAMVFAMRVVMTVVYLEKAYFFSIIFVVYSASVFTRVIQTRIKTNDYMDYFHQVNDFLRRNEKNPVTGKREHFMEIWRKERPRKIARNQLIFMNFLVVAWYSHTVHSFLVNPDLQPVYWSPYINESKFMRYFWYLHEVLPTFCMIFVAWYLNVIFMSIVTFQYAQLLYVRELASATVEGGTDKDTKENMLIWLQTHQQVLELTYKVTDLLGLHALTLYFAQMFYLVLSIVLLLSETVVQTTTQKILCIALGISHMIEFGHNCIIVDRWETVQNSLRDIVFTQKTVEGDKWRVSAYNIFMARAAKPLVFVGYYFVTLNAPTVRVMMMNVFSLYTSLRSVMKSKSS